MATLASTRFNPGALAQARPATASVVSLAERREQSMTASSYERAVYQPSRRAGPVAVVASAAVLLAVGAALATLNIVAEHKPASHLTVVSMKQLDTTPPPPPPAKTLDRPVAQPQVAFVPKPMIALPAPGPTQVALDVPPPVQPPVAVAPRIAAPVAPAAAFAPAAGPVEGGDLSSQVLSAKPPVYPIDARRQRIQGTVKLVVLVGPDGRVSDVQVATSSGSALLDKAALSAVRHWRWRPQKQNGVEVAVRGTVPVTFALA